MIGFKISARGSMGFKWDRGAWTEGSLWLAKGAIKLIPKSPESKGSAQTIDLIEEQFAKIKDAMFSDVANLGIDLHLSVTGDFKFMYQFQPGRSGTQTAADLLHILSKQKEDMRDQVMIYFCRCLLDFRLHCLPTTDDLSLKVDIDL